MMKIMTCNIRFDNPADQVNSWPARRPLMSDMITTFAPDLLATQEGRRPQIKELASSLHGLVLIDKNRQWIEERMYPSFFVNSSALSVQSTGDVWLSESPQVPGSISFDSAFPRLFTWILARSKKTDQEFFAVNTHLDHIKTETRQKQIEVLVKEIAKLNTRNLPVLLCGDFNESPFGDVRKILNRSMPALYDPWIAKDRSEETTFHKFKGQLDPKDGGARIDWILCDKRIKTDTIMIDRYSRGGLFPSDHFPVKGIFHI
jgi:endonuclease/exonuclease/phosphatase family metal-dependent hydrolase